MANATKELYNAYKNYFGGGGSVTTTPEVEEAVQNLQQAYAALQEQVNQLPTEDTDTIFDPTPINETLQALQQEIQDNGTLDLSNITALQNAIDALQEQVDQLPTEDTDTIFDPTPLNESISVLQTSLQQFREQAEIAQAQQAAALAANAELDAEQQQTITALNSRITALENESDQTKIIGYQNATAQEIIAFIEQNPHAPIVIDNGGEQHTVFFALKQADDKVMLRVLSSISGKWHIFQHTITNSRWTTVTFPLQDKLESGTSIKTINGESLLGSGNIEIQSGSQTDNDTQADWNETDITSPAFIKNKPALPDFSLVPQLVILNVTVDNIDIPAGGRINKQPEFANIPAGFEINAYRQISVEKATDTTEDGWRQVFIQTFSTAGSGTKANISLVNSGSTTTKVKLKVTASFVKIGV